MPFEMRTDGLDLESGDGHVDTWLTCRPATEEEEKIWEDAVRATREKNAQRAALNVSREWHFENGQLLPPVSSTRMLDSYDDRYLLPPKTIFLTPEQAAIERAYMDARTAIKNRPTGV